MECGLTTRLPKSVDVTHSAGTCERLNSRRKYMEEQWSLTADREVWPKVHKQEVLLPVINYNTILAFSYLEKVNRQQTLQLEIHSNVSTEERMARETFSSIQWAKLIIPHKLIFCHHLLTLTSHLLFHARKKVNGDRICLFSEQICINVRILGYFTSITRLQTSGKKTIHMYTHKCL